MTPHTATRRVTFAGYRVTVPSRGQNAIAAFTEGMCDMLAIAVHDATGWPIAVTYTGNRIWWDHAFVINPKTGMCHDIQGRCTKNAMQRRWGTKKSMSPHHAHHA